MYTRTSLALAAAIFCVSTSGATLAAQAREAGAPSSVERAQGPTIIQTQNATETRREFYKILDQHPPALGRVFRLDPTLLTSAQYLAAYPRVAAFVAQNPDVPRNPGYYLERYDPNYQYQQQSADPKREALAMWRRTLEFFGALLVFGVILASCISIVRYIVEYRRWHRTSKVNADVHNKILDRFASNDELLAYIDSPAGRRFLEATPIATGSGPGKPASAPISRILLSVQIGILLIALAFGLWVVSHRAIEEVRQLIVGIAVLGFFLGTGSIISAGASYVLSRRLGLLPDERTTQAV